MTYLRNPDKEDVLQALEDRKELCYDKHIEATELYAATVGDECIEYCRDFEGILNNKYQFSRSAMTQLLNRHKVPVMFYDRCPVTLKRDIFNHFVGKSSSDHLFRMIDTGPVVATPEELVEEHVRACLTNSYGIVDDHHVFPVVFDVLATQNDWHIHEFVQDEQITRMLVHFDDAVVNYKGTHHTAGLWVVNSETGHSSVWIEPVVSIPGCTFANRYALRKQSADIRIVHRGEVDKDRIRSMVANSKDIAQVGIVQLMEAWEERVTVAHALGFARSIDTLPKRMYDILEEEWANEEELAKAVVAQKIIALAAEMPLFQRIQVEQSASRMTGLFDNYKIRMQAIAAEINED